jgi:transposase
MKAKTQSFVTEVPLVVTAGQERILLVRFDAARQVYNACLGESLRRLDQVRQSRVYQKARKMPKTVNGKPNRERAKAFAAANAAYGLREYDLHAYAVQFSHCWLGEHLDSNTVQKVTTRAFQAVQQHAVGARGSPRFRGKNRLHSVEGKSNASGILWRDNRVVWKGLELHPTLLDDPVVQHGLAARVKYVRIVRREIAGRNRFYAQLVCEGEPYQKPKNRIGDGVVGLDIGPSTIAVTNDDQARLLRFCDELVDRQKRIRQLQRKLDRQRRANNPENYTADGTVQAGPKRWRSSNRQRHTRMALSEIQRKQAAQRKSLHGQLANQVLAMGHTIRTEKLSYRAFQKVYGKSVGFRAPGLFISILRRKAVSAGGAVEEFPTRTTRLSQVCICGAVEKKPLTQRWHRCGCGVLAQRDLFSAFLARCVEGDALNAGLAGQLWPRVDYLLQAALSDVEATSDRQLPASFGLNRRLSCSLADVLPTNGEALDVVAHVVHDVMREPERAAAVTEPPGFSRGE